MSDEPFKKPTALREVPSFNATSTATAPPLSDEELEIIMAVARAIEPGAFATYDRGHTVRNGLDERAFLNAEKVVKRTIKKARAAIAAHTTALTSELERCREALRPFAELAQEYKRALAAKASSKELEAKRVVVDSIPLWVMREAVAIVGPTAPTPTAPTGDGA